MLLIWKQKGLSLLGKFPKVCRILWPEWNSSAWNYLPGAFGIAFVTTVGSFVMAKNIADRQPKAWNANRDMIALGAAKMVSAFLDLWCPLEVSTAVF